MKIIRHNFISIFVFKKENIVGGMEKKLWIYKLKSTANPPRKLSLPNFDFLKIKEQHVLKVIFLSYCRVR